MFKIRKMGSGLLNRISSRKRQKIMESSNNSDLPIIDLAPVDDADGVEPYLKALSIAFRASRIKNIALTGPYGSGKSSIIKTFKKNNKGYNFLNISLASFKEENLDDEKIKLIERSILQQMLYGADANKLPYSRFKKIATPKYPIIKSSIFVAWSCTVLYLYSFSINPIEHIFDKSFTWKWAAELIRSIFLVTVPIVLVDKIYKATFSVSLKRMSLKNAEIEINDLSEDSILNRHLDEIIYFFQVTNYKAVVIEDLDRFGNPEIFVRLRELNAIINSNRKKQDPVVFLYALKDDMFFEKNRAKFFDLIIPVIPIVNSSNSLDMMQRRLEKFTLHQKINSRFLREVSFYIDDLRLIYNIFNEFLIYYEKLKSERLNTTKLFAMIIYKNEYPTDFENLHHGKGAFFQICEEKKGYQKHLKQVFKKEIEDLKQDSENARKEEARSVRELIDAYVGRIISHAKIQNLYGLVINNNNVPFHQITTLKVFEPIISEANIHVAISPQAGQRRAIGRSFSEIEEEINPGETFQSRLRNIKNKKMSNTEINTAIRKIDRKIDNIPNMPIGELLKNSEINLNEILSSNNIKDGRLLIRLVRDGYLDDTYYLYTSNFYEGRLTRNDREYIRTVLDFGVYDPRQVIDTPAEVCENIRAEDFGNKYTLNIDLVDYLIEKKESNTQRLSSVFRYISTNYENSREFIEAYLDSGKYLDKFIVDICNEWPGFVLASINSNNAIILVSAIVRYVDEEILCDQLNVDGILTDYLSHHGQDIFVSELEFPNNYAFLKALNVKFENLALLDENSEIVDLSINEFLFAINAQNLIYILRKIAGESNANLIDPEKANYTALTQYGSSSLKDFIKNNMAVYLKNVFLTISGNIEESEESIVSLISSDVDDELKRKIIQKENHVFANYEKIPPGLWLTLLENKKILPSWLNLNSVIKKEEINTTDIEAYLNQSDIVDSLSEQKIDIKELGEDDAKFLSHYILSANFLNIEDYRKLVSYLPYIYFDFPEDISDEKRLLLCEIKRVKLSDSSFASSIGNLPVLVSLIEHNIDEYLENKDKYPIEDNVREKLIESELNKKYKLVLCSDLTVTGISSSDRFAKTVSNLLAYSEADLTSIDQSVIEIVIQKSESVTASILLLTKCILIWDKNHVLNVLSALQEPYSEIAAYGKRPKIPNNDVNLEFAKYLLEKGIISSIKEEEKTISINTFSNE